MSTTERTQPDLLPWPIWIAPAALLLLALGRLPSGYYDFLRLVVCGVAIALAVHDYRLRDDVSGWSVMLALVALVFNPLIPVHLTRAAWAPIDLGAAAFLAVHYASCRRFAKDAGRAGERRTAPAAATPPPSVRRPAKPVQVVANQPPPAHRDANSLPPKTRLKHFEIVRELGAGGFGITYLALDDRLNRGVALKEYFPVGRALRRNSSAVSASSTRNRKDFEWGLDRFVREAQVLARLSHPNIVDVHDCFEANDTAYIVMDYVEGESLSEYLQKHGTLTPAEWRPWLEALMDGLQHVHAQRQRHGDGELGALIHRDINPANIVIRASDEQPVLIDFGAARFATAGKTQHVTAVHTPGYAPIEQLSSKSRQGPYTDIYALAAVSCKVLSGELPPDAADRAIRDEYRPLALRLKARNTPLLAAIDSALAVPAEHRPQTIGEWRALMRKTSASAKSPIRSGRVARESARSSGHASGGQRSTPMPHKLQVSRVRRQRVTSNGNRYLECETDAGLVAFWGKNEGGPDNISLVQSQRVPFTATVKCIPAKWNQHRLWVHEDEAVDVERPPAPAQDHLTDDDIPF